MEPVQFLFDFISPYAYLAWTQVHRVVEAHGRAVAPVPVLFAALLDAHGTLGPAEVPAKRRYVVKDIARRAQLLGVPIQVPYAHPFNPLPALRVALLADDPNQQRSLIEALFRATWVERRSIGEADVVREIAGQVGLGADAIERAARPEIKEALRNNTARALAAGVFGVPSMRVDGELFWGGDSLPLLDRFLAGRDCLPQEFVRGWQDLPSAAQRKPGKA